MENFAQDLLAGITEKNNATQAHLDSVKAQLFEVMKVPLVGDVMAIKLPEIAKVPKAKFPKELLRADIETKDVRNARKEAEQISNIKILVLKAKNYISKVLKLRSDVASGDVRLIAPAGKFGIYKLTGGHCLGVMGNDFNPMQPIEFFETIISTVQDFNADLDLNTLQFKEFCKGSKIEFSICMLPLEFKNTCNVNDVTNMELTFSTSYDGTKSNVITLYTHRLVCSNGMVAKENEGYIKGRNTKNGKAKVLTFVEEIAYIINSAKNFREQMEALDKQPVTKAQIEEYKFKLFGYNKESLDNDIDEVTGEVKANTTKHSFIDVVDEAFEEELKRTGYTKFGLLQGATNYSNHYSNRSEQISQEEFIRFFQGAKINDKAQELIFEMA